MTGRPRTTAVHEHFAGGAFMPGEKLKPPDDLSAPMRAEWDRLTMTLPIGFFTSEHTSLLAELCRHSVFAKELGEKIEWALAEMMNSPLISKSWIAVCRLLKAHSEQTTAMISLSRSLRITKQSRTDRDTAAVQTRRTHVGLRPWEDWSNPEPEDDALDPDEPAELEPAEGGEPPKQ